MVSAPKCTHHRYLKAAMLDGSIGIRLKYIQCPEKHRMRRSWTICVRKTIGLYKFNWLVFLESPNWNFTNFIFVEHNIFRFFGNKNKFIPLVSRRFVYFLSRFSREFYLDNLFLRHILFNKKHKTTTCVLCKKYWDETT